MCVACEYPRFCYRCAIIPDNAACIHILELREKIHQLFSGAVFSDEAEGIHLGAEGQKIINGVPRAAGIYFRFLVFDDDNRRLP